MTPEQMRIKIAEACGWKFDKTIATRPDGKRLYFAFGNIIDRACPDYLNDLNAMHEAEMCLKSADDETNNGKYYAFCEELEQVAGHWEQTSATALQRAEAFLRTLGLWEEEQ
jgi:hypothetical protein